MIRKISLILVFAVAFAAVFSFVTFLSKEDDEPSVDQDDSVESLPNGGATDEAIDLESDELQLIMYPIYEMETGDPYGYAVGYSTTALKPSTEYRVTWSFDRNFSAYTSARLLSTSLNGTMGNVAFLSPDFVIEEYRRGEYPWYNFEIAAFGNSSQVSMNSYDFTSGAEGDRCFLAFFMIENTNFNEAYAIAKTLGSFVYDVSFVEIGG